MMWFNRTGHYVKLNHQKGEVSDESVYSGVAGAVS